MRRATGAIGQLQCIHGNFYPRSPCGERPGSVRGISSSTAISIHALLAESDNVHPDIRQLYAISIHALLAESDSWVIASVLMLHHFYPRSPCGERLDCISDYCIHHGFLSTLSLRRATAVLHVRGHHLRFLSTLSLRRATRPRYPPVAAPGFLSTLSLRRATFVRGILRLLHRDFYPRSPCGERPARPIRGKRSINISIHALLAESDTKKMCKNVHKMDFYPRSPCGERRSNPRVTMNTWQFLSTLSLRRATRLSI